MECRVVLYTHTHTHTHTYTGVEFDSLFVISFRTGFPDSQIWEEEKREQGEMKERRTRKEIKENTKIEFCREANSGLIEKYIYIYIYI